MKPISEIPLFTKYNYVQAKKNRKMIISRNSKDNITKQRQRPFLNPAGNNVTYTSDYDPKGSLFNLNHNSYQFQYAYR
jgi:hypothetical protein